LPTLDNIAQSQSDKRLSRINLWPGLGAARLLDKILIWSARGWNWDYRDQVWNGIIRLGVYKLGAGLWGLEQGDEMSLWTYILTQNAAKSIFWQNKYKTFNRGRKKPPKMMLLFNFQKSPNVNNLPISENSPNLVTLAVHKRQSKRKTRSKHISWKLFLFKNHPNLNPLRKFVAEAKIIF
jgi:hypothetical protein